MAAPKNNQFWKLRSKHGRDKLFASAELLWDAASEYFEWCDKNPLMEIDFVGMKARRVKKPKMMAYTITGLCLYLGCNKEYFTQFKKAIKDKEDKASKDFSIVITRIEEVIYTQKFTGAAAGFLDPRIISRDLGLADKQEITGEQTITWKEEKTYEAE